MRKHLFLLSVIVAGLLAACKEDPNSKPFQIKGKVSVTNFVLDSIKVVDRFGFNDKVLAGALVKANPDGSGTFEIHGRVPMPGIYQIVLKNKNGEMRGMPPSARMNVILGEEDTPIVVNVTPMGNQLISFFETSDRNKTLQEFYMGTIGYQRKLQNVRMAVDAGTKTDKVMKAVDSLQQEIERFHKSYAEKPGIVQVAATMFYTPGYDPNREAHKQYKNEEEYYAKAFFANEDLKDPRLAYIPEFFQKCAIYTQTMLARYRKPQGEVKQLLADVHARIPANTRTEEMFLGAVLAVTENGYDTLYTATAEEFLQKYPDAMAAAKTKEKLTTLKNLSIGGTAPDIELKTADDKAIKLSSLRGKYVLVDFWASWCAPCKDDAPAIIAAYEKYKAKGFEIYGVSLDSDKGQWQGAIKDWKLNWLHVSDLKASSSELVKTYNLSAIPTTYLLDKDGKIIAKNLRGAELEKKLAEIIQ
jgi:peroxiredoxin